MATLVSDATVRAQRVQATGRAQRVQATGRAQRVKGCCIPLASALAGDEAARLASVFRAMGDPTRVQMLHLLQASPEPICVCDFTAGFELGQPTVSHHLARLRDAGFVTSFKRGVWAFYSLREDMPPEARRALALIPGAGAR